MLRHLRKNKYFPNFEFDKRPEMNYPIRLFVVEDHPLVRVGLSLTLSQAGDKYLICAEAGSVAEAFEVLPSVEADVVLLDIMLPDGTGLDIAKRIRKERPALKVLVLSAETDEDMIIQLVESGIDGFVSKNIPPQELYTAIEYVADGAQYFGKDISRIIRDINNARRDRNAQFTERENEIISLCAEGLAAKEIAARLFISIDTVNAHKYNIFKKLGINNSVELVRYAIKHGIIKL